MRLMLTLPSALGTKVKLNSFHSCEIGPVTISRVSFFSLSQPAWLPVVPSEPFL